MYTPIDFWNPQTPPKPVLYFVGLTASASLFCALLSNFFLLFNSLPPQYYLSLSLQGIEHLYLWQFLTYFFIEDGGIGGISFNYLLILFMNMAIIWFIGSSLCATLGNRAFTTLYLICGLIAGTAGLIFLSLFQSGMLLSGTAPIILGLLVVWGMLNPEAELLIFFLIPLKSKWIVAGILGAVVLTNLSQMDLIHLIYDITGAVTGYIYAAAQWNLKSPFRWTHSLDDAIYRFGMRCSRWFSKTPSQSTSSKIVDFHTGQFITPEEDDQFMDRMLNKIAQQGEKGLTEKEKKRMKAISERKRQQKNIRL